MSVILLNNLISTDKKRKRVGRGDRSHGNKSGRGSDGQKSRSGSRKVHKEGGQMPIYLRANKRGFTNRFKSVNNIIHTSDLYNLLCKSNSNELSREQLLSFLKCNKNSVIKVLFDVAIDRNIKVAADSASKRALEYITLIK